VRDQVTTGHRTPGNSQSSTGVRAHSAVRAGEQNTASGQAASVSGGAFNTAQGFITSISGGISNSTLAVLLPVQRDPDRATVVLEIDRSGTRLVQSYRVR
jgi:hypothetical protein